MNREREKNKFKIKSFEKLGISPMHVLRLYIYDSSETESDGAKNMEEICAFGELVCRMYHVSLIA